MNKRVTNVPDSLYHYTSVGVLCKLFTGIKKGRMIFHASSVDFMNDSAEYAISRKLCRDEVDNLIAESDMGMPFALCFTDNENNIPMWSIYADGGKGACLKFNYLKLDDFFRMLKAKGIKLKFSCCEYKAIGQIKRDNKPISACMDNINLNNLYNNMTDAAFIKPDYFIHEREWRLMVWNSWVFPYIQNISFKEVRNEICPYIEIPIPVDCLEGIILGPSASDQMIEAVKLMRSKYIQGKNIYVDKVYNTLKV